MSGFTASNGIPVWITGDGWLMTSNANRTNPAVVAAGAHVEAIAEFFRAREDDCLGRWRWPENPDYVVYDTAGDGVWVYSERGPGGIRYQSPHGVPKAVSSKEAGYAAAARAYFAAHPEPKPWHEAEVGDHWALHIAGPASLGGELALFKFVPWMGNGLRFVPTAGGSVFEATDPLITAGHRVWPEVAS